MVELTVYPSITTLGVVGTVEGEKVHLLVGVLLIIMFLRIID